MSETVIEIKDLSKIYKLGVISTGSFASDLTSKIYTIIGLEDPNSKLYPRHNDKSAKKVALSKLNLKIKKGEILGVIGKNGAGKSTLLKILSRITAPTSGYAKIIGRTSSLLEVGTGFHPELTGRENIFLNGSIMGMTKREIRLKLNEIIDFSGIKEYIDTPVKRYSSGMIVRLGFSIAAHLEPEILFIDEVLAVGDLDFQKKCLGKIESISNLGRTVIFVSHNMVAVQSLCTRAILIDNGKITFDSTPDRTVAKYLLSEQVYKTKKKWELKDAPGSEKLKFLEVKVSSLIGEIITIDSGFKIDISCYCFLSKTAVDISFEILSQDEVKLIHHGNLISDPLNLRVGEYRLEAYIPAFVLNEGSYKLKVWSGLSGIENIASIDNFITFEISNSKIDTATKSLGGLISPKIKYKISKETN